ncbi:ATP-dependent DNA helicase [Atractiella rhizophila]|nr:ATP-dependent DNA helicase [Atractiella rhizophila]
MGRHSGPWDRRPQVPAAAAKTSSPTDSNSAATASTISAPPLAEQNEHLTKHSKVVQESEEDEREKKLGETVDHVFRRVFGKREYKGKQREIMLSTVKGHDILVVAPTGMGKSLCFQVPALVEPRGVTLVICPLLSLMLDQVNALKQLGINAEMWSSNTTSADVEKIRKDLKSPRPSIRLLYITPERLLAPAFSSFAKDLFMEGELNRLVIDEAHCVIEWGHQFRKDYLRIGEFREAILKSMPEGTEMVPITAVTASASSEMQTAVIASLSMRTTHLSRFAHSFNRPNLYYEFSILCHVDEKITSFIAYFEKLRQNAARASGGKLRERLQGIVYCRLKKRCDYVADQLRKRGIQARAYHRDLKPRDLEWTQKEWVSGSGKVDVVVATVAFGMGIDKKDCRFVVHFDIPTSFEGYYQETGRAGRDGRIARCLLYYSKDDAWEVTQLMARDNSKEVSKSKKFQSGHSVSKLIQFIENVSVCRHLSICSYFGEDVPSAGSVEAEDYCKKMCDVCKKSKREREKVRQELEKLTVPESTQKVLKERAEEEREEVRCEEEWARSQEPR